jgi:hypothetical protein
MAETSAWNIFFGKRPNGYAIDFDDVVTKFFKHPSGDTASA